MRDGGKVGLVGFLVLGLEALEGHRPLPRLWWRGHGREADSAGLELHEHLFVHAGVALVADVMVAEGILLRLGWHVCEVRRVILLSCAR